MTSIAFIIPSKLKRGPIIFTENLIQALSQQPEIRMEVFYIKEIPGAEFPVPATRLRPSNILNLFKFDILHSTMFVPDLLLAVFPIPRRRKISSLHNFLATDLGYTYGACTAWVASKVWYWSLGRIKNLIFSSTAMANHYRSILGTMNGSVISYGIPEPTRAPIDAQDVLLFNQLRSRNLKIIGAICMVNKRKAIDQLVMCLPLLKECAVVVIGEGPEKANLENMAKRLGVADRFHVTGFRDNSSRYNAMFDLFAMVSWSEGFGLAMLEAMACSVPVVCSELPIYTESISKDEVAYFTPGDTASLARAIVQVLDDPAKWSDASRRLYQEKFNLAEMGKRHAEFYRSCLGV